VKDRADVGVVTVSFMNASELRSIRAFLRTSYTGRLAIGGVRVDEGIWIEHLEGIKVVC
jgi:hypothetical protein